MADIGTEGSIVRAKNGLRYSIIDSKGQPIGIPIKASSIYGKPTFNFLQTKFEVNELLRSPHKDRLKELIDQELRCGEKSFHSFIGSLIRSDVYPVVRQNAEGRIYGITFVDNRTKCVFNGSDLGKQYSAKAILDRLTKIPEKDKVGVAVSQFQSRPTKATGAVSAFGETKHGKDLNIISDIMGAHLDKSDVDSNLRKKRKKRRGKSI